MQKKFPLKKIGLSMLICLLFIGGLLSKEKTNVIYILADDLGYGEVGYQGQEKIKTPRLDDLAKKGMTFTSHYCGNSVCAPSRCSLMTGKHPGHAYIRANSPGYPGGQTPLPEGAETLGTLMKRAGYKTGIIGKWGLGGVWTNGIRSSGVPEKQGFDHFFGFLDQRRAHNYYPDYLWRNSKKIPMNQNGKKDYAHDKMTEEAISFIKDHHDKPFFLYLAYLIPHVQYQVPSLGQYKGKNWPKEMKIHAAMTTRMDRDIGKIVDLLEELKISNNTLVIFNSDNGAHGKSNSAQFLKTSGELKGLKRSMYEGGVRSPMLAYWPGTIKPGRSSDHISAFWDMLPTLSDLTNEKIHGETDGISMLPTLLGHEEKQKKHKYLYWELYEWGRPNAAVRMGRWKGVIPNRNQKDQIQLFDLSRDQGEQIDLANQFPEVVDQIRKIANEAHVENPFWKKGNQPLYDVNKAIEVTGLGK